MREWLIGRRLLGRSSLAVGLVALFGLVLTASATAFPSASGAMRSTGILDSSNFTKGGFVTCTNPASPPSCQIRFGFESEQVTSSGTGVDTSAPGTYSDATTLVNSSIPSGTCVDSWLVTFDNGANAAATADGSIDFQGNILGVDALAPSLDATDSAFGHAGTTYPTGNAQRGMELANAGSTNTSGNPDSFTIAGDQQTLAVHSDVGSGDGDLDQMRVFTSCVSTTMTLGIAPRKIVYSSSAGETETLKASVSEAGVDNGPISGTVTWSIDGTVYATASLRSSRTVPGLNTAVARSVALPPSLTPGYHQLQVSFSGEAPEYGANSLTKVFLITDPNSIN